MILYIENLTHKEKEYYFNYITKAFGPDRTRYIWKEDGNYHIECTLNDNTILLGSGRLIWGEIKYPNMRLAGESMGWMSSLDILANIDYVLKGVYNWRV